MLDNITTQQRKTPLMFMSSHIFTSHKVLDKFDILSAIYFHLTKANIHLQKHKTHTKYVDFGFQWNIPLI